MSGSGPIRLPAKRRAAGDAKITSPWFGPQRLAGRPGIFTFVGTEKSFVELLFEGVTKSGGGHVPGAFPAILAMRDFAEPPRALLNGDGSPAYVREHVEPTDAERPIVGELAPDEELPSAIKLADLLPPDALPPLSEKDRAAWLRKLYLPMHQHFHVVACQLDCDRPGAPRIDPRRVIEAGLVVRRFIPDPKAAKPRWEDWIPSPHGDGVWVEIAGEDMITLNGTKRALDPVLPADVFGAQQGSVYRRLGVGQDPEVALSLSTAKLATFPVSVGESKKRTARWGFVPVTSSEKERELADLSDKAQEIAAAFAAGAEAHMQERILDHAPRIEARVTSAVLPLLQGLSDALPDRPTDAIALSSAYSLIASLSGGAPAGEVSAVIDELAFDVLLLHARRTLDVADAEARWTQAVGVIANIEPDLRIPALPGWVYGNVLSGANGRNAIALVGRDVIWKAMDAALPGGTALGGTFEPRLLLAVLQWLRSHRVKLLRKLYAEAFTAFGMPIPEDEAAYDPLKTIDPNTKKRRVIRAAPTVGALGQELDAWLSMNTDEARKQDPVPWKKPSLPQTWLDVHALGTVLEDALADVDGQGAGAGGAYADYLDEKAAELAEVIEKQVGFPLAAQGIDLRAQPERGLLLFPGPAPTAASLSTFKDAIEARYTTDAQSEPEAVRNAGKARRQVIRNRYDASNLYAVWCYARVAGRDSCEGPQLVWSRRTEVFALAEPMDLLGLKPVAFQLPEIPKLMRDIPRMRKARALPFAAVTTPQDSGMATGKAPEDTARAWGIAWICSFGIPIFTICAWILFQIVLSILLVIPGFAWMLLLKICIPVPKRS